MEWPTLYHNFDPQKKCARYPEYTCICQYGRQFKPMSELKAAIIEAFDNIDALVFQRLVHGMPHRIFHVIYKNGGYINY